MVQYVERAVNRQPSFRPNSWSRGSSPHHRFRSTQNVIEIWKFDGKIVYRIFKVRCHMLLVLSHSQVSEICSEQLKKVPRPVQRYFLIIPRHFQKSQKNVIKTTSFWKQVHHHLWYPSTYDFQYHSTYMKIDIFARFSREHFIFQWILEGIEHSWSRGSSFLLLQKYWITNQGPSTGPASIDEFRSFLMFYAF